MEFGSVITSEDLATAYGSTDALQGQPQPRSGKFTMWSAKQVSTLATLNVRTLYAPGKLSCTLREINRYRCDVLGLAETHWVGEGEITLDGVRVLFSGREDGVHREGVAILLNKEAQKAYVEHRPVSSRIISVTLKGQHKNAKIIQVYAPDSNHDDEGVEQFYESLSGELERSKSRDLLYIIGDFNSKVGADNDGYEDVMGRFGIGNIEREGREDVGLL